MYNYPHFKEQDKEEVLDFMRQHPFVTLIGTDTNGRMEATHIPVLIDERNGRIFISGHIAAKTDHIRALTENPNALVIFSGAHTYVSSTWYTGNPQMGSTWNYIAIHARGKIKWMDENGLIEIMKKLSLHFENGDTSSSATYDNLPDDYKEMMIKAIRGFEIEVTELDHVYKLSQNRDEKSYDNIVAQLKKLDGDAKEIGELMEKRKSKVFPL